MAYIQRVKNTSNRPFDLHDPRLDSGEGLNVIKDWEVNDPNSSKYITNRTHYTGNRFELINPNWSEGQVAGRFTNENAPEVIELDNDYVLYKLSNTIITSQEILDRLLDKCIVYYKPYNNVANIGTFATVFNTWSRGYATTGNYGQYTTEATINASKNNNAVIYKMYYVENDDSFVLQNTQVNLTKGLYALSLKDLSTEPYILRVLKGPDEVVKLPYKYIPNEILTRLNDLETSTGTIPTTYATIQYVDEQVNTINTNLVSKMDKTNPIGTGTFNFTGNINLINGDLTTSLDGQNTGGRIIAAGNIYANGNKLVATQEWANAQYIPLNQTDFSALTINNVRVATIDDLSNIEVGLCKGYFSSRPYLDNVPANNGDYAYVWEAYIQPSVGASMVAATAKKYIYNGEWLLSTPTETITNTFTPIQWKNINEASSLINELQNIITSLEDRVAELEEKCEVMFEQAEGKKF